MQALLRISIAFVVALYAAQSAYSQEMRGNIHSEDSAFAKVEKEVRSAARDGKTLVVWIFDRGSLSNMGQQADKIAALHVGNEKTKNDNLESAVVAYGDEVKVLTDEPLRDVEKLKKTIRGITKEGTAGKLAYAAVAQAAEKFGSYRQKGYEVIFVLDAADAAADEESLDKAVKILRRMAIPVYSFGVAQPLYVTNPNMQPGQPFGATWMMEHISLFTPARVDDANYVDSGFGMLGLERICRLTDGQFFRYRTMHQGFGWTTDGKGEVSPQLLRKYAPDLVSEAEYKKLIESNKARLALVEATKMVVNAKFENPKLAFVVGKESEQARFATMLTNAQQKAAKPEFEIERIYNRLAEGEADRKNLHSPRWEAAYDLAMGRALGGLARTKGYNKMLAQLKSGKPFKDPSHTMWELKVSENFSGDSQLNSMAKKSRDYLIRVKENHPHTPWADIATLELDYPCGWDWDER
jgi:hypothetical protein